MSTTTIETQPGLYSMPREQYDAIKGAINISCLLEGAGGGTMAHVQYALTHEQKGTQAQLDGIARHVAAFEPAAFEQSYALGQQCSSTTKKGEQCSKPGVCLQGGAWFCAIHRTDGADDPIRRLTQDVWDSCIGIRDNCQRTPWLKARLDAPGTNEVAVVWRDPAHGVLCKGRLDRRYVFGTESGVLDLKTLSNDYAGADPFSRHVANYRDHLKAAWYLDALDALQPCDRSFTWIAAESAPPYMIALWQPDPDMLDEARRAYSALLGRYAECVKTGIWPGYDAEPNVLSLPKWAYNYRSAPQ